MTKSEILDSIKAGTGIAKADAARVLDAFTSLVMSQERLAWPGLGVFKHTVRAARKGRNPATGEPLDIPEKTVLTFKWLRSRRP